MKTYPRPRRRFDVAALALDAPLPFVPTCAGMRLSWPSGSQDAPATDHADAQPLLRATQDTPQIILPVVPRHN